MEFELKTFEELDTLELYEILKLRSAIFVVEQNCVYQDIDDLDILSHHLIGIDENFELGAYVRILPPKLKYEDAAAIGRVVVHENNRKNGTGTQLMQEAIRQTHILYPNMPIKISAQAHLETFYNNVGFTKYGTPYLEDNIPHIAMELK